MFTLAIFLFAQFAQCFCDWEGGLIIFTVLSAAIFSGAGVYKRSRGGSTATAALVASSTDRPVIYSEMAWSIGS